MSDPSRGYDSVFRPGLFAGRTALVTGGGTGIGRCIAHELAHLGAHVVVLGRREEPLASVAREIALAGGRAEACPLNVRDDEAVDRTVRDLAARLGRIDLLVNNAGGQFFSPASAIRPKGWRAVIDTNLSGTWYVSQAAYAHSMAEHGGAIVSIVAEMWNGFPGMAHTGAARAAVVNLTMTLSVEWASSGVRVNAVAPGAILSSGLTNYPEELHEAAAATARQNPSSRLGTESEVAAAVTFLLSPAAAYVTGVTLRVDGGSSLQKAPYLPLVDHDRLPPFRGFHLEANVPEAFRRRAP
jgi:citronellol/citronellal dehydrogenase